MGRGRGAGARLGVGIALGVCVAVGVDVGVNVALAVAVGVALGVVLGVGVVLGAGVPPLWTSNEPIVEATIHDARKALATLVEESLVGASCCINSSRPRAA